MLITSSQRYSSEYDVCKTFRLLILLPPPWHVQFGLASDAGIPHVTSYVCISIVHIYRSRNANGALPSTKDPYGFHVPSQSCRMRCSQNRQVGFDTKRVMGVSRPQVHQPGTH